MIQPAMLAGPDGKRVTPWSSIRVSNCYAISKNCRYPEAAFRMGDLLMNEKYGILTRLGEPGVDIVTPPAGSTTYYPGVEPSYITILGWGVPNNKRWEQNSPHILSNALMNGLAVAGQSTGLTLWSCVMVAESLPYVRPEREIGPVIYTTQESETISEIRSNVETYWQECFTRFVIRDMSIENDWNKYLAELKAMGLDTYINTVRTAYARMMK